MIISTEREREDKAGSWLWLLVQESLSLWIKSKTSLNKNANSRPAVKVVYPFVTNVVELSFVKFTLVIFCMAQMFVGQLMWSKLITLSSNEHFYGKHKRVYASTITLNSRICLSVNHSLDQGFPKRLTAKGVKLLGTFAYR